MEHEFFLTAILNSILGPAVSGLLGFLGIHPKSPSHPFTNYFAMELLVVAFIIGLLAWVRSSLSVEKPGNIQQSLELVVGFLKGYTDDIIGHDGPKFVPLLFTMALFIFLSNIMGEIPGLETPTSAIEVTAGCALVVFLYYNFWGFRKHGVVGYLKTFLGPVWPLAPLMFLIEVISNLARLLSLSVRLYANMLAGERITEVFSALIPVGIPVIFMAFHVLVVATIQTFVFFLLTVIYLGGAVSHEH